MEIIGRKYLDRNDYDSVIITPKLIRVFGDDNYDTIKSSNPFSTSLNGISRVEVIDSVIDYFLRYTRVSLLSDANMGSRYILIGNEEKLLKLGTSISRDTKDSIFKKYISDRDNFLSRAKSDSYILDYANRKSNYGVTGDAIKFILAKKDNELVKFEKEFLSRILDSVLSTTVTIKHEDGYSYLVSGNVSVRLDFIDESVISAINKHNANIEKRNLEMEKQKSLQLKMEVF